MSKKILVGLCFFIVAQLAFSQNFWLINDTDANVWIRVWRNGTLIHDHQMLPGNRFEIPIEDGFLLQRKKFCGCDKNQKNLIDDWDRQLPDGWEETYISKDNMSCLRRLFGLCGWIFVKPKCINPNQA